MAQKIFDTAVEVMLGPGQRTLDIPLVFRAHPLASTLYRIERQYDRWEHRDERRKFLLLTAEYHGLNTDSVLEWR